MAVLTVALARLPWLGAVPEAKRVLVPEPPSWPLIALGAAAILAALAPYLRRFFATARQAGPRRGPFPWFGWAGLALTFASWAVAWGLVPPLAAWRPHTFTPLWVGYVLVVLGWTRARGGACLLDEPRRLLGLTALSAVFWWFFEYLNEFVGSWSYSGVDLDGPLGVLSYGVLPFATVLPAVTASRDLLATLSRLDAAFVRFVPVAPRHPRVVAGGSALAGLAGVAALGAWPHVLFPLVWLAPLLVLTGAQAALGLPHVFGALRRGDHRAVVTWALAGLMCGLFWEGWNWLSVARWSYAIPYLGAPKIFEMPLLGYAGYLAFGWQCAAVAGLVRRRPGRRLAAPG